MVAAGVLSAPVATPAMGIGARSLWKAGLFREDAWREWRLGRVIPDAEHFFLVALPGAEI